jgi:predicted PhzF superfamily epimerase YddE/YHI9
MKLSIYQIDAFAEKPFEGNPAAVIPLQTWLPDALLQNIAQENNLSETAYFVEEGDHYRIRWFTPVAEVKLCGHATLASAYVLFNILGFGADQVLFTSQSGQLSVLRRGDSLQLDFPQTILARCECPPEISDAFGIEPLEVWRADDYMAVYRSEAEIAALDPDFTKLRKLETRGVIATARGVDTDFVCRFFAPRLGIDEDPATGSAYCALTPYWADMTGKQQLSAAQLSKRGARIECELHGERVFVSGTAVKFLEGRIEI